MGIGFAEGMSCYHGIPCICLHENFKDLLVCVALGVDMVCIPHIPMALLTIRQVRQIVYSPQERHDLVLH